MPVRKRGGFHISLDKKGEKKTEIPPKFREEYGQGDGLEENPYFCSQGKAPAPFLLSERRSKPSSYRKKKKKIDRWSPREGGK